MQICNRIKELRFVRAASALLCLALLCATWRAEAASHLHEMTEIRQGDPRSIEVGVKVLTHKAEMNGYKAPARVDMTGTRLDVLVQQQAAADAQAMADLDRLTLEELREYRRLEAKARGVSDVIENETVQAPEAQPSQQPEDTK